MMRAFRFYIISIVVFFSASCSFKKNDGIDKQQDKMLPLIDITSNLPDTTGIDTIVLRYATGFEVRYTEKYKEVTVKSPVNETETLMKYYLVRNDSVQVPEEGIKIKIPLRSLAATSCTHFEFIRILSELSTVTGICSPELAYNREIREGYENGAIKNLGSAFDLNFEQLLVLHPQAIMISGFNQISEKEKRIIQAGIPVIYNNEWREKSLLGRAEWLKFVSLFYDKERIAGQVFSIIENNYNNMKAEALRVQSKPSIVSGTNFKGVWYMPGGQSYMGQLFADAGADYFYKNDTSNGSLPLNFEVVLKNFRTADFWVGCSVETMDELKKSDERYALFSATTTGNVYNQNNRTTSTGGNDFWESAVARPDLLLADMVYILHPELMPGYELVYMKKLQ